MTAPTDIHARKARVLQILAALGRTPTQVGQRLLEGGHFGRRGECGRCPVAVYLMASDLGIHHVLVGTWKTRLWFSDDINDRIYIGTPEPIIDFIVSFDTGSWSELVAAEVSA